MTDREIRQNPAMMEWIAEHGDVIRNCGYEDADLIDQFNLVQMFCGMNGASQSNADSAGLPHRGTAHA